MRYVYDHRHEFAPVLFVLKKQLAAMKKGVDLLVNLVKYVIEHHLMVSLIVQSFRWITAVHGLGDEFMAVVANVRDIVSEVGDHTVLSDGKWPQAVY